MGARRIKRSARLPLPWERENSPFRSLFSGRRFFPLLVLLAIGGVLAGAHWLGARRADIRATRATLHEVSEAARAFVSDIGRCPRNPGELVHPPRSGVHYLHDTPTDAWGQPVLMRCSLGLSETASANQAEAPRADVAGSSAATQSGRADVASAGPSGATQPARADLSSATSLTSTESPRSGQHTQVEVWSAGPSGSFFDDDNVI
jgi:hypothetical protein